MQKKQNVGSVEMSSAVLEIGRQLISANVETGFPGKIDRARFLILVTFHVSECYEKGKDRRVAAISASRS